MTAAFLEEDFRFVTKPQVQSYSSEDLKRFPHIDGFNLTQLLDQIDGQVLSSQKEGRLFQALIEAPGGTALCLANHLKTYENLEIELYLTLAADAALVSQLEKIRIVKSVTMGVISSGFPKDRYVILTNRAVNASNPLGLICYDPEKQLASSDDGKYFMNSNVWVRCGN